MKRINININYKKISLLSFALITVMGIVLLSKSYAIYKLEEKYNIIQSQINKFNKADVVIAAIVDGKEATEFPSYETNYKVESIECSNGVVASWDIENWRLAIDDMSASSTKCTISFDSTKTNTTKPINMSKVELLALNEDIKTTSARTLADYLYPVGSIYLSTEDDTVNKVEEKFGGTWVKLEDRTLIGASSKYEANSTGGSETHSHQYGFQYAGFYGDTFLEHGTTSSVGLVNYSKTNSISLTGPGTNVLAANITGNGNNSTSTKTATNSAHYRMNANVSYTSTLPPYLSVYMYKRTA